MRHSIFCVILTGIALGALFFFMPKLVLGIFIFLAIIRLLHCGHMSRGWYGPGYYGHGYRHGCECGPGYWSGDDCYSEGYGDRNGHAYHHGYHHHPVQGKMFYWADKIRKMSEEEYTEFKNNMDKGFGFGYHGGRQDGYDGCGCGNKSKTDVNSDSATKKEDTTQNNESK
jgi:hypothetical protein